MKLKSVLRRARLLMDRFCGLDFLTVVQPEDVGLDLKYAYRSSPSGNIFLKKALIQLDISENDSIIDIGCGKGSAMRTMLSFPFVRVDGIELSDQIAAIAVKNFKKLKENRINVFVCDASLFEGYDKYNFVYFYNPFPSCVMSQVIERLTQSIKKVDRELVIVYNNATCHEAVESSGIFARQVVYPDEFGNGISIYSNHSADNSRLFISKNMYRTHNSKRCRNKE